LQANRKGEIQMENRKEIMFQAASIITAGVALVIAIIMMVMI
jgi:hypothetical protein